MTPQLASLPRTRRRRLNALLRPETLALLVHRVSHLCYVNGWYSLAVLLECANRVVHKVSIPASSCIGPGCRFPHPVGAVFHGSAGSQLTLFSLAICSGGADRVGGSSADCPYLGDSVTVGAHATLMGPINVGDNTMVGFGTRLAADVPDSKVVLSRAVRNRTRAR